MNDTTQSVEIRRARMIASKSPEERLRMASSMFDAARELVESGIRSKYGNLSRSQMRFQVFLRFYREDFSASEIETVMKSIPDMQPVP